MTTIFAYGTLRSKAVREAVLGRDVLRFVEPCLVRNFSIRPVSHGRYPAVTPSETGESVSGTLLFDVSTEDMIILDAFEDEYLKHQVDVFSEEGSIISKAIIYVWNESFDKLDLTRHWSYQDDFEAREEQKKEFVLAAAKFGSSLRSTQ
jgi:gamma-glutamylcyclotransferase (GGCT)/AIG2-like uncharacterized protein YtfP